MTVIADTSAWHAYFVVKDLFHKEAINYFQTRPQVITTNMIIEETIALLHHRQGKRVALAAQEHIHALCGLNVRYISSREDEEIFTIYKNSMPKLDYVDASVVWLSRKLSIPVFTFDGHFRTMKIDVVP